MINKLIKLHSIFQLTKSNKLTQYYLEEHFETQVLLFYRVYPTLQVLQVPLNRIKKVILVQQKNK